MPAKPMRKKCWTTSRRKTTTNARYRFQARKIAQLASGSAKTADFGANMAHFLVSMCLVACAFMLDRSSRIDALRHVIRPVPRRILALHRVLVASATVAIVTGTVVTATGPHAGSEDAVRFGFRLVSVARVHSVAVIATVALMCMTMLRLRNDHTDAGRSTRQALGTMAFVAVLQGAVGYLQYFTGVPVVLVGFHVAGATAFWLATCNLLFAPRPDEVLPVA